MTNAFKLNKKCSLDYYFHFAESKFVNGARLKNYQTQLKNEN